MTPKITDLSLELYCHHRGEEKTAKTNDHARATESLKVCTKRVKMLLEVIDRNVLFNIKDDGEC